MPKQTLQDRLCAGLIALGYSENKNERSRYRSFSKPGDVSKFFVGTSGALRRGECASRSFSLQFGTRDYYNRVLAAGDKALDEQKPDAWLKDFMQ